MRIARVFPRKTKMSPVGPNCYYHYPAIWTPKYDEVHISVCFTWDLHRAEMLVQQWSDYGKVKIGGPAMDDPGDGFEPGMYLKKGVTITSRGCPNNCDFCFVPEREGGIRELEIKPGHIIQDNNLLACSKQHIRKVFEMLRHQTRVDFAGGLEAIRITELDKAEGRLKEAWEIGTLPFAMRYRTSQPEWAGTFLFKDRAWNLLTRQWTRPAITKTIMKGV